ncbi:MAG: glutamyl-tRNA(Gln) and/or aspartyl-tRNA(Asn) amidotransferase subunit [Candidatus Paceibacter sp.]|jgi:aspartyl-tRNA(Asn)/glutamyl-tRNA(Gln) amidotransferase subunit C|nr:glutamyl-tRNA(Gln) and/or aspartyl-tRNA(Asn) amidotransferase subunit [Candidatus Paceibacter sp.]
MISKDDVKKLANLARIKLTSEEEEKFAKDMENILGYVTQIQNVSGTVDARGTEKVKNALREDNAPHESGIHTEAILAEAPKRKGDYVQVKKILGGGGDA